MEGPGWEYVLLRCTFLTTLAAIYLSLSILDAGVLFLVLDEYGGLSPMTWSWDREFVSNFPLLLVR